MLKSIVAAAVVSLAFALNPIAAFAHHHHHMMMHHHHHHHHMMMHHHHHM